MDEATRRTLRRLARTRTTAQMKALFAAIRAGDDASLLAAAKAPRRPARSPDVARGIADRLSAIVAPANERAEMLIDELAATQGAVSIAAAGLAPTVRKLIARYGEAAVLAAADSLLAKAAAWGSTRERVT